jgi:hypothetical protein
MMTTITVDHRAMDLNPALWYLQSHLHYNEPMDPGELDDQLLRVIIQYVGVCLGTAQPVTQTHYCQYLREALADIGMPGFALSTLAEHFHVIITNGLCTALPCPLDQVEKIEYVDYMPCSGSAVLRISWSAPTHRPGLYGGALSADPGVEHAL